MSSSLQIARAASRDFEFARQAICEVYERQLADEAALQSFLSDPTCCLLMAIEGDRVVGSLNGYLLRRPNRIEPQFLLYEIDVRSECRRRGIGEALVSSFVEYAKAAGAAEVWVLSSESNVAAIELFLKCGFRRVNRDDVMLEIRV